MGFHLHTFLRAVELRVCKESVNSVSLTLGSCKSFVKGLFDFPYLLE